MFFSDSFIHKESSSVSSFDVDIILTLNGDILTLDGNVLILQ